MFARRSHWKILLLGGFLAASAICRPAAASFDFGSTIKTMYTPDSAVAATEICLYCHTVATGGQGTANQPFGVRMRSLGLRGIVTGGGSVEDLTGIIDNLIVTNDMVDSDGDLDGDILELTEGSDPSDPGVMLEPNGDGTFTVVGAANFPPVAYGCGAHVSPSTRVEGFSIAALAALALVGVWRRRRTWA